MWWASRSSSVHSSISSQCLTDFDSHWCRSGSAFILLHVAFSRVRWVACVESEWGEKIPISLMTRMKIFSLLEAEILSFGTDSSNFIQIQVIKTACRKNYSDLWGFTPFISFPMDFCVLSHSCATGWQAPAWMPNRFPANPEIQSWDGATLEPCLIDRWIDRWVLIMCTCIYIYSLCMA